MKSRKCELSPRGGVSRRERTRNVFDACQRLWQMDISRIYDDVDTDERPIYYVYAHMYGDRKIAIGRDGKSSFAATLGMTHLPFYVGKGTGDRLNHLDRNETHRKVRQRLSEFGHDVVVKKLIDGLTEGEALAMESKLIDVFGVVGKGGSLVNLDEGHRTKDRRNMYMEELKNISMYNLHKYRCKA